LIGFLVVCFGAAYLGGKLTDLSVDDWYPGLIKPSWTPSGAAIGIVWTILYTMMAVAAWLAWMKCDRRKQLLVLSVFLAQLVLNITWSALFFGLRSPLGAAMEIIILWTAIFLTTVVFMRVNRLAGLLLIPYLLWVGFAAVLNWTIWFLNASIG
jgi:tryptophan-rich sensory protein